MRIKYLLILVSSILIIITASTLSIFLYKIHKSALLEGIDNKLLTAAYCIEDILPENYHDRIVNQNSVPMDEYLGIVDTYNKLCIRLDLQYMWSLMVVNDQIVFTSGTSAGKDVAKGDHASFFDTHTNPGAYKEAFSTMNIQFSTFHDKWGEGRMVLIPKYNSKGNRYLLASSMSINHVNRMVSKTAVSSLMISAIVLFIGLILSFILSSFLSNPVIRLTEVARDIANGNLDQEIKIQGSHELRNLSESICRMAKSMHAKIEEFENQNRALNREMLERKQAEEELRESEKRFRAIFEQAAVGVALSDTKTGKFIKTNKRYLDIIGYSLGEINAANYMKITHPKDLQTDLEYMEKLKTGQIREFTMEKRFIRKDGSVVWSNLNVSPMWGVGEEPNYHIAVIEDITESKMAGDEKTKLQLQLQHAQKMESIGTLAGGIAHDFNNILFPIIGYTEMLLADVPEDSPMHLKLKGIYAGALRARDLVKQILTFSRQDINDVQLISIQPLIKETLKLARATIPTSIEIKQDIKKDCGLIKADPTQIHQVVMNLTTNAYHAMEDTGGELKVSLAEIELAQHDVQNMDMPPGLYVRLIVADTGVGMDKKLVKKIFDPYFTTKERGKGTGMGLSVVHGIVKNAGGSIKVYSEPTKGAEFQVFLPAAKPAFDRQSIQTKEPIQHGTEQILLVDDEDAIVSVERQMLERLGYSVTARTSSIEALKAFRTNPDKFDLVISDMTMPNMTGDQLAAELIRIRPDIPVLLCTGFSEKLSDESAEITGIRGLILKPIVIKDISRKVREVLDEGQLKST